MATCTNCQIQYGSRYSYRERLGLRMETRIAVLCDPCRDTLTNLGLDVRLERRTLVRFPAKDMTGWLTTPGGAA